MELDSEDNQVTSDDVYMNVQDHETPNRIEPLEQSFSVSLLWLFKSFDHCISDLFYHRFHL